MFHESICCEYTSEAPWQGAFNEHSHHDTKACMYNVDPLKRHFNIVKLWFTGVYITFLISVQNIDCWYSLEPPRRGARF